LNFISLRDTLRLVILPVATALAVGFAHQSAPSALFAFSTTPVANPSASATVAAPTRTPSATPLSVAATPSALPTADGTHPAPTATPTAQPSAQPSALDAWVFFPLSKNSGIPASYAPTDLVQLSDLGIATCQNQPMQLREQAAMALAEMFDVARTKGYTLYVCSAYRSYSLQVSVYAQWVEDELRKAQESGTPIPRAEAEARANRYSALPGYSEHQLGTTVDVSSPEVGFDLVEGFGQTPGGKWLEENAQLYGFSFSYPDGKEELTGYVPEPWHLRWIGRSASLALYNTGYLDPTNRSTLTAFLAEMGAKTATP
jgi:zinc D-Ala-D-Ala carboxypeptidase